MSLCEEEVSITMQLPSFGRTYEHYHAPETQVGLNLKCMKWRHAVNLRGPRHDRDAGGDVTAYRATVRETSAQSSFQLLQCALSAA